MSSIKIQENGGEEELVKLEIGSPLRAPHAHGFIAKRKNKKMQDLMSKAFQALPYIMAIKCKGENKVK